MKSIILATSLMVVLVSSKPLEKRYYVTETDVVTVTVTETGWAAEATEGWGQWGQWSQSTDPTTTTAAAAATTSATPDTWVPSSFSTPEAPASTTATTATTTATPDAWVASSFSTPEASASTTTASTTTPTTTATASSWSSAPTSSGSVSSYAQAILDQHNNHRANHSANALVWDDNLANIAQQIGASCVYAHNTQTGGGGYGQNIGAGASPSGVPALITDEMYNDEIGFFPTPYGQASPDMSQFENWGHFSQIVWQSTTSVGCATVDCSAGGLANTGSGVSPWFTVCNYSPPGNFAGEYGSNIAAPRGDATVTV